MLSIININNKIKQNCPYLSFDFRSSGNRLIILLSRSVNYLLTFEHSYKISSRDFCFTVDWIQSVVRQSVWECHVIPVNKRWRLAACSNPCPEGDCSG